MGMNLTCRECSILYQTPGYIAELCLWADIQLGIKSPWQTVLHKYLAWLDVTLGNQAQNWQAVHDERQRFQKAILVNKTLTFDME